MRIVIALGGNALLQRGQPMTAENQRANIRVAAERIAAIATGSSGTLTLDWVGAAGSATGTSVSGVINVEGMNMVRCVAKDTSGNRTVAAIVAPVVARDKR